MTKLKIGGLILAVLLLGLGAGLATAQTAALSASISGLSEVTKGETLTLTANLTGGNGNFNYQWNFGDGEEASGQIVDHTYALAGTYSVNFIVSDTDGQQASASHTVTVSEPAVPSVPLEISISQPAEGMSFAVNQAVNFQVAVTGGNGNFNYQWNFGDGEEASGQIVDHAYALAGAKTVTVAVADTDGLNDTATRHLTITAPTTNPTPSVTFTANGQTGSITVDSSATIALAWNASDATACTASGDWTGDKGLSGTTTVGPFAASSAKTFVLACAGAGGTTTKAINVAVSGGGGNNDLIISNVRVTDVTRTGATIRWTTNRAASSRVIYDTSSHSTLGSAPNYGYQFTTSTTDTGSSKVTEHAVTVSGLTAGTHYFFRVISED